jgi:putative spermidine/putrescine transport system permease protein
MRMSFSRYSRKNLSAWTGIVPFLVFCLVFEIVPVFLLLLGSFSDKTGAFSLVNYEKISAPIYVRSFWNSIQLSAITAVLGAILGLLIGYAIFRLPSTRIRETLLALSDVTTNFAGAPLAFAFIVILGSSGVVTLAFEKYMGVELYPTFSIYSYSGLILAYLYFQLPLMILIIIPAFTGLRREWWESARNLGANTLQYWRRIGLPILTPSLIAGVVLLFANAFGAYATAWTLGGSNITLVTIQIAFTITGEVLHDPGAGDAMAMISLLIMSVCIAIYQIASTRARRWAK